MLRSLLRAAAAIAAPPGCGACGSAAASGVLCRRCADSLGAARPLALAPGPPGVDVAVAAGPYEGAVQAVVHGLKFRSRLVLAGIAAELMAAAAGPHLGGDVTAVPVPADPRRWAWRGFDPAEELALALARELDLPVSACLRRRPGPRQVGRPRSARLASPPDVRLRGTCPAVALLVDDVWTTGATLSACASALRSGGCAGVIAVCVARAVPSDRGAAPRSAAGGA